jgi:hypothetical protein
MECRYFINDMWTDRYIDRKEVSCINNGKTEHVKRDRSWSYGRVAKISAYEQIEIEESEAVSDK